MNFNRDFHYKPSITIFGNTQMLGWETLPRMLARHHEDMTCSRDPELKICRGGNTGKRVASQVAKFEYIMYFQSNLSWFSGFPVFSCTTYGFLKWVGSEITPFFGNSTHLKHQLADYEFQRFLAWYSQIGNRSDPEFAHIVAVERLKVGGSMI